PMASKARPRKRCCIRSGLGTRGRLSRGDLCLNYDTSQFRHYHRRMRLMFSSGAGYSHIEPMLPLAAAARDAGDDVVFVTGPDAVHHVRDVPAVGIGATARLDEMLAFVKDWRPDLVITNLAERAAMMAACIAGVHHAQRPARRAGGHGVRAA